ncbi:MAG TPA: hypothetical protein VHU22_12485 [Xanthobacteraceae bacterium]|jgi:hypothetical protein|nr:hypothetical protein [Xanthobacteraceae bacterium]
MSSPKRAARTTSKSAAKSAAKVMAKPAPRRAAAAKVSAKPASKPAVVAVNGASADAKHVAATLDRILADGNLDAISAEALQALIASACRLYRARREAGEEFAPVPKNSISATDVMVTASGLLKATDLAVFELGMWQNWTGR